MNRSMGRSRGFLARYFGFQRGRVMLLTLCVLGGLTLQVIAPQIVRFFLDTATSGGNETALMLAALAFLAAGIGQRTLEAAAVYLGEVVGWRASNTLRADLTDHVLRLDMGFHKRHTPGELIERVDGDVGSLENFFSQFSAQLVGNALLVLAIVVLLAREDWRAGAAVGVYALIVAAALLGLQQVGVQRWASKREAEGQLFGFLEERFAGTEDICAAGAENHTLARLDALGATLLRKNRTAQLVSNLTYTTTNLLYITGYALGLALGAYLYIQSNATIGTAFLIVFYIGMLSAPLERIRQQVQDLQQATAALNRISELQAIQPLVRDTGNNPLPDGALGLDFDQISFRYDDDDPEAATNGATSLTINNVSFSLAPGKVLGLLGRTGSGKTTLTRLLFRLYDVQAGAIRLGGTDLRDVPLADLRARIGMVTQDVQLFRASVRDNLALFDPTLSDGDMLAALDELGLNDWLGSLPNNLDTVLGAGGHGLSAGEAQLLAFARVLLHDPSVVVLDEASSRLDPATERLLEQAIDRLLRGRTAIVIAHRLGTVRRADDILILEHGTVIEHGPRSLLAADDDSRFASLLRAGMEEVLA